MLVSNTLFPSVSFFEFYTNLLSDIVNYEILPVEEVAIFSAKKFVQKFKQKDTYTPKLPLLSIISNQIQMDERAQHSWHAVPVPEYIKSAGGTIYKVADIGIYYSPVQLTGTFEISYIGTSYAQLMDFQLHMNRLFMIQKYTKYEVRSIAVIPETALRNVFPGDDLDKLVEEGEIPYTTLGLTGDKRYILPVRYDVLLRLTGQSDQSKLFGDTELPEFMSSLSFEFVTTFPHFLLFEVGSRLNLIRVEFGFSNDNIVFARSCLIDRLNNEKYVGIVLEFIVTEEEPVIKFSSSLVNNIDDIKVVVYDNYYGNQVEAEYSIEEVTESEYVVNVKILDYIDEHEYIVYTYLG